MLVIEYSRYLVDADSVQTDKNHVTSKAYIYTKLEQTDFHNESVTSEALFKHIHDFFQFHYGSVRLYEEGKLLVSFNNLKKFQSEMALQRVSVSLRSI